jgi:hypothetical protein
MCNECSYFGMSKLVHAHFRNTPGYKSFSNQAVQQFSHHGAYFGVQDADSGTFLSEAWRSLNVQITAKFQVNVTEEAQVGEIPISPFIRMVGWSLVTLYQRKN